MKEDILSVRKMKHKLVTLYLFLLVVACFCQVAVKKEGIAACSTYSLNCLDAAKSTNQGLPIPYEFSLLLKVQTLQSLQDNKHWRLASRFLSSSVVVVLALLELPSPTSWLLVLDSLLFLQLFPLQLVALRCGACVVTTMM
jgi:hypothetical protein